jgi:hypothetical protein
MDGHFGYLTPEKPGLAEKETPTGRRKRKIKKGHLRFVAHNLGLRVVNHSHKIGDRFVSRAAAVLFGFVVPSGPHRFCFMCF